MKTNIAYTRLEGSPEQRSALIGKGLVQRETGLLLSCYMNLNTFFIVVKMLILIHIIISLQRGLKKLQ